MVKAKRPPETIKKYHFTGFLIVFIMANLIKSIIFPTLVYKDHEVLTEENLSKINDFCKKVENYHSQSNLYELPIFDDLSKKVLILSEVWMNDFDWEYEKLKITGMWANKMRNGQFHRPHMHPNNLLSGVFYPEDNSSEIIFLDPRVQAQVFNPTLKKHTFINSNIWTFPARKNTLLLFPAWLMHYVEMVKGSDENRVSVSFNVMLEGKIGKSEDFTESTI